MDSKTRTALRIKQRWGQASGESSSTLTIRNEIHDHIYSGSNIAGTNNDFLGDWRSADNWLRFDMARIRARSRQLERGNPYCKSFKTSLINNVCGHAGFTPDYSVYTSMAFGDATDGVLDEAATAKIAAFREKFEKKENFTTHKMLSRKSLDRMLVCRLFFDGEVIFRKIRKFEHNEFGFSWQPIDPDYLDHNLNRIEPNGNITKMGVERHVDYKFPVAYWFLKRRPNDYFYNYKELPRSYYERVPAEDIIYIPFLLTEDAEMTRGVPAVFAAAVNLFRMGKFEEAALINATIGASKMGFFKKTVPDGITQSVADFAELRKGDRGEIIDEVEPGSWVELPWNVELQEWNPNYPDAAIDPFSRILLRSIASALGSSYASLTGDYSDSNFSSSRMGQDEEREQWKTIQQFIIDEWKQPEHEESVYRAILAGKLQLPLSKLDKFTKAEFVGRRWQYFNPVDDVKAKAMEVDNCFESIGAIIKESGRNPTKVFRQIASDNKLMAQLGIQRTIPNAGKDTEKQQKPKDNKTTSQQ